MVVIEHRCPVCHSSACVPQLVHCFRPRGGLHWVPPMAYSASLSLAGTASVLWADFAEPQVHAFELIIHFSLLLEQSNQPCGVYCLPLTLEEPTVPDWQGTLSALQGF